ncbi:DUF5983 family protein [Edaphovirga cremea]|uniref:DUF5983 family protein n=1 Tax=Edaphovirga cremea TaxID=2267246 RepID=UPI0039899F36
MERISGVVCSTAHLTADDNERLGWLTDPDLFKNNDWIYATGYGYIIQLNAYRCPSLALKEKGLSKTVRKLIVTLMKREKINIIHFDRDADIIDVFEVFDW